MQQLYEQISERFERLQEVVRGQITSQRFRVLKEQEKNRCDKENFIISMMRANKSIQIISKNLEIMKKINPQFKHEMCLQRLDENFLNDFVGLYRHFFFKYEEMFNFKLKIQNLIRPTNHNLIIDLVKYLLDFSRDYYQQTFFWYAKSQNKVEKVEEETCGQLDQSIREEKVEIPESKKNRRSSLNEVILQKLMGKKPEENNEVVLKKDPFKVYEILEIASLPAVAYQQKDITTNVQVLKMRINEIYRDMKSRNIPAKTNSQSYYNRFFGDRSENKQKQYIEPEDESINRVIHPFKLTLIIEKNGFNYISASISQNRYYTKAKDKKLSPLKVNQRIMPLIQTRPKGEYMLTSLKIIRISQNFLPPILGSQPNIANTTVNLPFLENNSRMNLLSSNSAANDEDIERKIKKQSFHHGTETAISATQQKLSKQKSIRKLSQIKRVFKSEEKREGSILPISNIISRDHPNKERYAWLEKLRQIPEIQRRKIMGLG